MKTQSVSVFKMCAVTTFVCGVFLNTSCEGDAGSAMASEEDASSTTSSAIQASSESTSSAAPSNNTPTTSSIESYIPRQSLGIPALLEPGVHELEYDSQCSSNLHLSGVDGVGSCDFKSGNMTTIEMEVISLPLSTSEITLNGQCDAWCS